MKKNLFIIISLFLGVLIGFLSSLLFFKERVIVSNINGDVCNFITNTVLKKYKEVDHGYKSGFIYEDSLKKKIIIFKKKTSDLQELLTQGNLNDNILEEWISLSSAKTRNSSLITIIKSIIKNSDYSIDAKKFYLNLFEYISLNEYVNELDGLGMRVFYGEVINISKKDTIKLGEKYKSKILLSCFNPDKPFLIIMENGDTIKNGVFEKVSNKIGTNKEKGFVIVPRTQGSAVYELSIEYFVKKQ